MISAVVLAKNGEKNVEECLQSLQWCDELVIVDDYSEDKTVEIAQKLGAKVFKRRFKDNFAAQRNFGLKQTKGEWVLFVDLDERVSGQLAKEIKKTIRQANDDGFYLKRRDWLFGKWMKHGETANIKLLRLARKGRGRWQRRVHETWAIKGRVGELKNPLLHYPHPTVKELLIKIDSYSILHAYALKEEGVRPSSWRIIANPLGKFCQNYFLRLGFLDGMPGLVNAFMMSLHSFLARSNLYLLYQNEKPT